MVVFKQSCCIREKWLYLGKSGCILAKWLKSARSECIREKTDVFGQKRLFLGEMVVLDQKWLYFGQSWLYSGKSGCIRGTGFIWELWL